MTCALALARVARAGAPRRPPRPRPPSLVRATLARNSAASLTRDPPVEVLLDSGSQIVALNGGRVWCVRYPGLAGLFRKDRGPSKALGRALCDEVKERFRCRGFLTTDELPCYGLGRPARRAIFAAAGAGPADCVVVYAYPEPRARTIDAYLYARLERML